MDDRIYDYYDAEGYDAYSDTPKPWLTASELKRRGIERKGGRRPQVMSETEAAEVKRPDLEMAEKETERAEIPTVTGEREDNKLWEKIGKAFSKGKAGTERGKKIQEILKKNPLAIKNYTGPNGQPLVVDGKWIQKSGGYQITLDRLEEIGKPTVQKNIAGPETKEQAEVRKKIDNSNSMKEQKAAENEYREVSKPAQKTETIPPEMEAEIMETDEGRVVQSAIEANDPPQLEQITNPETGEGVLSGHYNDKGEWVPYVKAEIPDYVMPRGLALALTLISVGLSGLSGGMFPPINFLSLRKDEQWKAEMQVNKDYADLVNGTAKKRADIESTAKGNVEATKIASEASKEDIDTFARLAAAANGSSEQMAIQANADLQKWLKDRDITAQLNLARLNNSQQMRMAELLYDQDVKKLVNQIQSMRDRGMSDDDIAKYVSSTQGTTTLARGLGYAKTGAEIGMDVVKSVMELVPSDKGVKHFDAKGSNNSFYGKYRTW